MQNLPIAIDSFEQYMSTIRQFEPLDRATEIELAQRYKNDNDLAAAHRLTCAYLRFVVKIANEYRGYGLKMLDLIQEGNIGLMMAIKKFDPERNIRLISYAVWWIRAYINSYIINSWSLVKIGTTQAQKKLFFKLRQTREALRQLSGSDGNDSIAHELDVSCDAVDEMSMRLSGRDNSLDGLLSPDGSATALDNLADERINQEEQLLEFEAEQQQKLNVQQAMATLNKREQHIISTRLLAEDKTTLQELAEYYQISKERVRQLEKRALEKLKDNLCATLVTDNT